MQSKEGQIRAKPFADWLNARVKYWEKQLRATFPNMNLVNLAKHGPMNPTGCVIREIGWDKDGDVKHGERRLYRHRHMRLETKRGGQSQTLHQEFFLRQTVEDALDHAGVPIWELYPEYIRCRHVKTGRFIPSTSDGPHVRREDRVDVCLEADRWCESCYQNDQDPIVTPIDGCCPWCDTVVDVFDHHRSAA